MLDMTIPRKTPLRWLAEHLLQEVERYGNEAEFTLHDKLQKRFDELKYGNLPALMDVCKEAFNYFKTFLPVDKETKKERRLANVESEWVHWIPVTYRILKLFETYAAEWKAVLKTITTDDEKTKLAWEDFRGGPLVKPFPFLPVCKNKVSCHTLPLKLNNVTKELTLLYLSSGGALRSVPKHCLDFLEGKRILMRRRKI